MGTEQILWPVGTKLRISVEGLDMRHPHTVEKILYEQNCMVVKNERGVRYFASGGDGHEGRVVLGEWVDEPEYTKGDTVYLCYTGGYKERAVVLSVERLEGCKRYTVWVTNGEKEVFNVYDNGSGGINLEPAPIEEFLENGAFVIRDNESYIVGNGPDGGGNYWLIHTKHVYENKHSKACDIKMDTTRFMVKVGNENEQ